MSNVSAAVPATVTTTAAVIIQVNYVINILTHGHGHNAWKNSCKHSNGSEGVYRPRAFILTRAMLEDISNIFIMSFTQKFQSIVAVCDCDEIVC